MENIKFGTGTPIKYLDPKFNMIVNVVAYGNIYIEQEISEDESRQLQMAVVMELSKIISGLSGNVNFFDLPSHCSDFNKQLSQFIFDNFNISVNVSILNLTMTDQSKQEYSQKEKELINGLANSVQGNPTIQSTKYCPNCGAPSTGKFCPNCGTKLL